MHIQEKKSGCSNTATTAKEIEAKNTKKHQFIEFQKRINTELLNHPIIHKNNYTNWFMWGDITLSQLQTFIIEFSVFSNQFLIAQLYKMLAANTLDEMRASKEILANELGVIFNDEENDSGEDVHSGLSGSVEGGTFHFSAAHYELLLKTAKHLDLGFSRLGKRELASSETLFFCDELKRLYGNNDYQTSAAASYAVENWAAAGFWSDLLSGLKIFRKKNKLDSMPLAFFSWHNQLEANHAKHTQDELEEYFLENNVDGELFIKIGNEMLDGVQVFWDGLNKQREKLH